MKQSDYDRVIDHVVNLEGQYGNDPYDSGGQTKYGIDIVTGKQIGRAHV